MNGKRERVLAGKILPNGKPLYGYSFGDTAHTCYVINERTAPIVIRIFTDVAAGIPLIRIAINLTQDRIPTPSDDWRMECGQPTKGLAWNTETLSKIIHHPAYTGNYVAYQWKTVKRKEVDVSSGRTKTFTDVQRRDKADIQRVALDHAAPAIVSHELAEGALSRLTFNKENASRRLLDPEVALLRGFVRCGLCGRKMSVQQARAHGKPLPGAYSYYCSRSRTIFGDSRCNVSRMFVSKLDNKVWKGIVERLSDPERLFRTARERLSEKGYQHTIEGLKHTIAECEEGQKSLGLAIQSLRLHEQGADSVAVLTTQLVELSNKKQDAQEKLEHCQHMQNNLDSARERLKDAELWCQVAAAAIQDMTFEQKRMTLFTLRLQVDVYRVETRPRWIARIGSFGEEDEIFTSEDADSNGLWGPASMEAPTGSLSINQIQKLVVAGQLLK
jgi:hypothetical protein